MGAPFDLSRPFRRCLRKPTHVLVCFRPPSWRPSHFLLLAQEKVTKENTPSVPRRRSRRFAAGGRGFADSPSWTAAKAARSLAPPRAERGPVRPPFAAAQRDPSQEKSPGSRLAGAKGVERFACLLLCFCGQDGRALLLPGSLSAAARTGGKSPQGRAHDARAFAVGTGMCRQRTSGASSRSHAGTMPA